LQLVQSIPANACEELIFSGLDGAPKPVALVIERGGCPFHVKMLHAERAGARLAVIINMIDDPLQRIGGMLPHAGQIGIPAVLLTAPAGKHLIDSLTAAIVDSEDEVEVTAEITIAQDNAGAEEWIDMAFYNWHEASSGKLLQLQSLMLKHVGNPEIVHWLQRQCDEINAAAVAAKAEL
jgi:hypothetical protein